MSPRKKTEIISKPKETNVEVMPEPSQERSIFSCMVSHDIGTSSLKMAILPLSNGKLDMGNIQYRIVDSCYAPRPATSLPGKQKHTLVSPVEGVVGKYAKDLDPDGSGVQRDANIYETTAYRAFLFSGLWDLLESVAVPEDTEQVNIELALGLPVSHMGIAESIKTFCLNEGTPWEVQKDEGRKYSVLIQRVAIHAQPYYTAVNEMFQLKGGCLIYRGDLLFGDGPVLVLDDGSNSVDMLLTNGELSVLGMDCYMTGTHNLLPQLRVIGHSKTRRNLTPYELLFQLYQEKSIRVEGEDFDFSKEVEQLTAQRVALVAQKIKEFLNTGFSRPTKLLLGGGGSIHGEPFYRQHFQTKFEGNVFLAQNDAGEAKEIEWAVARGALKLLILNMAKREKAAQAEG